jgi:hypothetical protein
MTAMRLQVFNHMAWLYGFINLKTKTSRQAETALFLCAGNFRNLKPRYAKIKGSINAIVPYVPTMRRSKDP